MTPSSAASDVMVVDDVAVVNVVVAIVAVDIVVGSF